MALFSFCPLPKEPHEQFPCETFFRSLFERNKAMITREVLAVNGLVQLLMKHRNTGNVWTREETNLLCAHLRELSKAVPALFIFMLPFGSVFLPLLVMVLDRRKESRAQIPQEVTTLHE
ncbi:MAG TPA: hypothetical protein VK445_00855 [Dissulfurispiraceae bacterium]|nr:hypothetical protein [Dissulfurispiraceae bacterium]